MLNEYKNQLSDADLEMVSAGACRYCTVAPPTSNSGGGGFEGPKDRFINQYWQLVFQQQQRSA